MHRFIHDATDDPLWSKLCIRNKEEVPKDSLGCTGESYTNVTYSFEKFFELVDDIPEETIQKQINASAKTMVNNLDYRQLLGREFTVDFPYTTFLMTKLKLTSDMYKSKFVFNELTRKYEEIISRDLTAEESYEIKSKFSDNVFQKSLLFNSDSIEVLTYSPGAVQDEIRV